MARKGVRNLILTLTFTAWDTARADSACIFRLGKSRGGFLRIAQGEGGGGGVFVICWRHAECAINLSSKLNRPWHVWCFVLFVTLFNSYHVIAITNSICWSWCWSWCWITLFMSELVGRQAKGINESTGLPNEEYRLYGSTKSLFIFRIPKKIKDSGNNKAGSISTPSLTIPTPYLQLLYYP